MIGIQDIIIREVSTDDVNGVDPNVRSDHRYDLCLGALYGEEIIGVMTARKIDGNTCAIDHFYVLPIFRSIGVGRKLVGAMERMLAGGSFDTMRFKFNSKEHSADLFSKFLAETLGVSPYQISSLYRIEVGKLRDIFINRYFADGSSPLDGFNVVFLSDLSEAKIKEYSSSIDASIPASLHPFDSKSSIIRECSLLVFNEEQEIIAWTLPERIRHNEVGVMTTYVAAPYRTSLLGLALWHRLYLRSLELSSLRGVKWVSFYFDVNDSQNVKLYRLLFGQEEQAHYFCADYLLSTCENTPSYDK